MRLCHVWQGCSDPKIFSHWNDGLRQALRIIEKDHEVIYREPWDDIKDVDIITYHEAPCTINGRNAQHYRKVQDNPIKKALLFAGGPLVDEGLANFDIIFTESQINDDEFAAKGYNYKRAFGINDEIFTHDKLNRAFDGFMQGTFASWKRQPLFAEALGSMGLLCGKYQSTDPSPYDESKKYGTCLLPEVEYGVVNCLINISYCVVNTAEFWGGGQRCTLEAMATNTPVIAMSDSPKNREYVEESGFGLVCDPNPQAIRDAVSQIKETHNYESNVGREYIESKFSARHYAKNLLEGINSIL